MLPVIIQDKNTKNSACVTENGQLIVAPISYSEPYYVKLAVLNTPYEIIPGITNKAFVITGILIASDKNFASATVAEAVTIYEAAVEDISTQLKILFQFDLLRNERVVATGLNIITNTARSLVGIAPTSAAVDITLAGYYL